MTITNNISTDSATDKSRRIVKNTVYMYIRMAILMVVSLYTVRVVYNTLGEQNYGIYNIAGVIIVFFSFLNNGLAQAVKRYITTEIAKGDYESGRTMFGVCVEAHLIVAAIVLLLAESVGLWCVNHLLNIPPGCETATNIVYQLSVATAVIGILQSPYNTVILAYERMTIYAYLSIIEALLNLGVVFAVEFIDGDKLIIYAWLVFAAKLANMLMYRIYATCTFAICRWSFPHEPKLLRDVFGYMGWSLTGQAAVVGTNQGASMLVNNYFGVTLNAAMGLSNSITNAVYAFVSNFQAAFNPQIVKSYATQEWTYLKHLIILSSKMASYLVVIFLVPIIFEIDKVLEIYIGEYSLYTPEFCILTLIAQYIDGMSAPFWMLVGARKDIKVYQICISLVYSMNFFGGWIAFALGADPWSIVAVRCIVSIALLAARIAFAKRYFSALSIREWLSDVLLRSILIIITTTFLTGVAAHFLASLDNIWHIIATTSASLLCSLPLIWFAGMTKAERQMLLNKNNSQR
ncbi:MAG: hypothetical protein MJZ15_03335 [Bacteroidales bacterium]|nr:hypothetical protein [Bacteroidales bacterium]